MERRAFTEAVAHAVQAAMPTTTVTVTGELQFSIRLAEGGSLASDLTNDYRLYVDTPDSLKKIIAADVAVLTQLAAGPDNVRNLTRSDSAPLVQLPPSPRVLPVDRSRIVPLIKPRQWLASVANVTQAAGQKPRFLIEPYNSELVVAYVEDEPAAVRYLTEQDDVGDRATLRERSLDNLGHLVGDKIAIHSGEDVSFIDVGGDYEASLLLLDELWSSGEIKVDGDIVIAVPAKDALLITGTNNQAGLARLRAAAANLASGPHGLTKALFVYRGSTFVPFDGK
jgi:hypothetical protein